MALSSSLTSITARTAYSSVKVISEVATRPAPTLGDTPLAVVMTPNTAQGCRPSSVKSQPNELAPSGSRGTRIASRGPPPAGRCATLPGGVEDGDRRGRAEQAEPDHQPEAPVGRPDRRRVVARRVVGLPGVGAVRRLVLGAQVVDALDLAVEAAGAQEGQQARDLDDRVVLLAVQAADGEDRERRVRLGRVETLGRRHLHGLDLGHDLAGDVAADGDADAGDQQDRGADPHAASEGLLHGALVALHAPQRHPDDERAAGEVGRQHDVREGHELDLVEQHGEEVVELGAAGLRVVGVAHGVLHPGVGGQDEVRREQRADVHQPDAGVVELRRQPVPAEDPQAEERRLEEERQEALDGQRRTEDVADEAGVGAPVHAELELLHDARSRRPARS